VQVRRRIALVSDIHGNAIALRAVLRDIRRRGVDEVVCLGDVATLGVAPAEVIDLLQGLRCRCVMGNHDEYLLGRELIRAHCDVSEIIESIDWCRSQLGSDQLAFVSKFEAGFEIELSGAHRLRLFHGSPASNTTNLLADTPAADLDRELGAAQASVMAGGHTHLQLLRSHRGAWLLNPGSVGAPFREFCGGCSPTILDHAEYATVGIRDGHLAVSLHKVALDRSELRRAASESALPMRAGLAAAYA